MEPWLASFEIAFPASTVEELLLALVVRDAVYGTSIDVETEDGGQTFQVDITASEEIDAESYQLLVEAEIRGFEDQEAARAFLEQILEEAIDEAERLVEQRKEFDGVGANEIEMRIVPEDDERWDLVIPDWLAPEGSEVPFGFRAFRAGGDVPYPSNADLDGAGRIVIVPFGGQFSLFGIPASN
ncbi:MAG: hypothetical protein DRJ65_21695 [Acidobacteria bacterium]|nr:MAG: hypothetical protein DRJ65_21695 [Acidobacteriota bacterium]